MKKSLNNQQILLNNLIVINSICFAIFGVNISELKAQQAPNLNIPLNVQEPTNKQNFIQQCRNNIQAQGIKADEAQNYCQCSADVVYNKLLNQNNTQDSSSEARAFEDILKCRQENITS